MLLWQGYEKTFTLVYWYYESTIFPMSNLALPSKFKMHTHFGQEIPFLGLWARVPLTQI